jgi:hypothetical protein
MRSLNKYRYRSYSWHQNDLWELQNWALIFNHAETDSSILIRVPISHIEVMLLQLDLVSIGARFLETVVGFSI